MEKKSQDFSIRDIKKLSESPAGKQLAALLRQADGEELRSVMQQASEGNYSQAAAQLQKLMDTPQVRTLLKQLEK